MPSISDHHANTFEDGWDQVAWAVYQHARDAGFHEARDVGDMDASAIIALALIHTEVSEAVEAIRTGPTMPDEHCPEYTNLAIELADTVIRIMDLGQQLDLDLSGAILAKAEYNLSRGHLHGGKKV